MRFCGLALRWLVQMAKFISAVVKTTMAIFWTRAKALISATFRTKKPLAHRLCPVYSKRVCLRVRSFTTTLCSFSVAMKSIGCAQSNGYHCKHALRREHTQTEAQKAMERQRKQPKHKHKQRNSGKEQQICPAQCHMLPLLLWTIKFGLWVK